MDGICAHAPCAVRLFVCACCVCDSCEQGRGPDGHDSFMSAVHMCFVHGWLDCPRNPKMFPFHHTPRPALSPHLSHRWAHRAGPHSRVIRRASIRDRASCDRHTTADPADQSHASMVSINHHPYPYGCNVLFVTNSPSFRPKPSPRQCRSR